MSKNVQISPYRSSGAKIFTGRDNGINARKALDLNSLDNDDDDINILIPNDTWGINPSFFGGLFEGSIKKLGNGFNGKYVFKYTNGDELSDSMKREISENIDYVIRNIKVNK